jgi:hypothetical protein
MKRIVWTYALALLLSCSPDYKSGSTKCASDGTCPSGFVCGGASSAGAPDVCYNANVAECTSPYNYYCPSSGTCWEGGVACSTVKDCGGGKVSACEHEGYTVDCSSDKCVKIGTGGSGGSGGGSTGTSSGSASIKFCNQLTSSSGQSLTLTLNINGTKISTNSGNCEPVGSCFSVPAGTATPFSLMNGSTTLSSGTIDLTDGIELLIRATLDSSSSPTFESNRAGGICSGGTGTAGTMAKFCNFLQKDNADFLLTLKIGSASFSAMSGTCSPIGTCTSIQSGTNVSLSLMDGTSTLVSGTYPTVSAGANMVFRAEMDTDSGSPSVFGSSHTTGICSPATSASAAANHIVFPTSSPASLEKLETTELSLVPDGLRHTTPLTVYRSIADVPR